MMGNRLGFFLRLCVCLTIMSFVFLLQFFIMPQPPRPAMQTSNSVIERTEKSKILDNFQTHNFWNGPDLEDPYEAIDYYQMLAKMNRPFPPPAKPRQLPPPPPPTNYGRPKVSQLYNPFAFQKYFNNPPQRQRRPQRAMPNQQPQQRNRRNIMPELKKLQKEDMELTKKQYDKISGGGQSKGNGTVRRLPQAIIFGVKKAGTTALRIILDKHPMIVASRELHFFINEKAFKRGLQVYRAMMPPSNKDQVALEKSPNYFTHPKAPPRIHDFNSSIKLILVVRDPVERIVSDYSFYIYNTKSPVKPSMEEMISNRKYNKMLTKTIEASLYAKHYKKWRKYFSPEQIHLVDGNKLKEENPAGELSLLESYLGVPHYFKPSMFELDDNEQFYCFKGSGEQQCFVLHRGGSHANVTEQTLSKYRRRIKPDTLSFLQMSHRKFDWKL